MIRDLSAKLYYELSAHKYKTVCKKLLSSNCEEIKKIRC